MQLQLNCFFLFSYLPEHTALGTAGGLYHYRDQIKAGSPTAFFVFNADVCCNFNLKEIMEFHLEVTLPGGITMVATEVLNLVKEILNYFVSIEVRYFIIFLLLC